MTPLTSSRILSSPAQRRAIFTTVKNLALLTAGFSITSWVILSLSETQMWVWWPEIISLMLSIGVLLATLRLQRYMRRAHKTHFFFALASAICQIPVWHVGIWFTSVMHFPSNYLIVGVAMLISIIGALSYYQNLCRRLPDMRHYNKVSGRLDRSRGLWDLQAPLRSDEPQAEEKWKRLGQALIPLTVGLGLSIYRILGPERQTLMFAIVAFILAYAINQGVAYQLAISSELKALEKEIGKPLLLPSENQT